MYGTILVATDGSEGASVAVKHAVGIADRFGAGLIVISVVETRTAYDNAIVDPDVVERQQRARAERALEDAKTIAEEAAVSLETVLRRGVPHEEVLGTVEDVGADLVVVGDRGRSAFQGALLGSTVDAIVRLAPVSVLIVDSDGNHRGEPLDEPTR